MDAFKVTRQSRSDTSGDESVRITAQAVLRRELEPAFLAGQLSLRLGPRMRVSNKYLGLRASAFQAGQRSLWGSYSLDKIWATSHRGDREWLSAVQDNAFLDHLGSAKPTNDFLSAYGGDAVTGVLLGLRHDVDSLCLVAPPDDDEPDDREWREAA